MSTTSRVVAVRTKLKDLLTAAVDADTKVFYSEPSGQNMPNDSIYNGDVRSGSQEIPVQRPGRKKREESFVTDIVIRCTRGGADSSAAETRAYALLAVLEDVLADDVNLGLNATDPTLRAHLEEYEHASTVDETQRGARCTLTAGVRVDVRLS